MSLCVLFVLVVPFVDCSFVMIGSGFCSRFCYYYTCFCFSFLVVLCYIRLCCVCSCFCMSFVRYCFGGSQFVQVGPKVVFVCVCFGCSFCFLFFRYGWFCFMCSLLFLLYMFCCSFLVALCYVRLGCVCP